jgi:hemerythrin superfamily protein
VDIYELLRRDHQEIDGLLSRLEQPPGRASFDESGRQYLLDRLVSVASRHEAAEELAFWPQVRRRVRAGAELAEQALQAEREAKALLDLVRVVSSETELADTCGELHSRLRAHARFEEDTVFPELRRSSTRLGATLTGIRFLVARRGGPTRPHSKGPDRPAGLLTRGAPAVLMDHMRDLGSRPRRRPVGFDEPERPDAVTVIKEDHQRISSLLARLEAQTDPDDTLLQSVIREVSIHDAIERQHLYPVVRDRIQDGPTLYQQLLHEHGQIGLVAANLDSYHFHDEARKEWIHELIIDLRTHIDQEEGAILPALAARLTHEESVDLGARLDAAKRRSPTRPHPHMAGTGTGARLSRLIATPIDKTRDALAGRRSA